MFNLMSGKLNLKPNEIKSVKLPKGKYKKAPIVQITSIKGNNCFLLEKVTKNYFIVSNCTQENISINYIVNSIVKNSNSTVTNSGKVFNENIVTAYAFVKYTYTPDSLDEFLRFFQLYEGNNTVTKSPLTNFYSPVSPNYVYLKKIAPTHHGIFGFENSFNQDNEYTQTTLPLNNVSNDNNVSQFSWQLKKNTKYILRIGAEDNIPDFEIYLEALREDINNITSQFDTLYNSSDTLSYTELFDIDDNQAVIKNHFFIINDDNSITWDYDFVNQDMTILTEDYSIIFDSDSLDIATIEVNLDDYTTPPEGESVTYTLDDDGSITDLTFYVSINNNTLSLVNNQMLFLAYDPLVFNVLVTLDSDPNVTATITMTFDPATQIYTTIGEDGINYQTASYLTSFRQYHITYNAISSDSTSMFILPDISQDAAENYIKITANIALSPNMQLNINSALHIYLTNNPEDYVNNRTLQETSLFVNSSYGLNLEDETSYYFWHDENDNAWYVSTERFPLS